MKKILITLGIVLLTVCGYSQTKYRVDKLISSDKDKDITKTLYPDNMYVYTVGGYVTVTDEAHSIYKQTSEIKNDETSDSVAAMWNATDEKGTKVICMFVVIRSTSEFYFTVSYSNITFMYRLNKE